MSSMKTILKRNKTDRGFRKRISDRAVFWVEYRDTGFKLINRSDVYVVDGTMIDIVRTPRGNPWT